MVFAARRNAAGRERVEASLQGTRGVMANAEVVIVGAGELPLITDLYNEIFRPPHDVEFFRRRLVGR